MAQVTNHIQAETWLDRVFASGEARMGGIVKREISDVERRAGREKFLAEVSRRGFQAVENNRHIVVFCNPMPVRRV